MTSTPSDIPEKQHSSRLEIRLAHVHFPDCAHLGPVCLRPVELCHIYTTKRAVRRVSPPWSVRLLWEPLM